MKTIITQKIDGLEIIGGLGRAVIDPGKARELIGREIIKTSEHKLYLKVQIQQRNLIKGLAGQVQKKRLALQGHKIQTAIKDSPEYKAFEKVKAQVDSKTEAGAKALAEAWNKYKIKEKELIRANSNVNAELFQTKEYLALTKAQGEANKEIQRALQEVGGKRKEILEGAQDIYFTPKAGERIVDQEEAEVIKMRLVVLPAKTFLSVEGEQIADRRGEKYWSQDENGLWKINAVEKLGDTIKEEAVPEAELSAEIKLEIAEQAEEKRMAELSFEDRQKEFETMRLQTRRAAAQKRSELEMDEEIAIINPGEALKEAKDWYNEQVAGLEEKYLQTSKIE